MAIKSRDYMMALERVLYAYKNKCSQQLHKVAMFENWTQERLLHFSQDMRVKILNKDDLVHKSGEFVREWYFVSSGKLRLERDVVIEKLNHWPATDNEKKYCHHEFDFGDFHKSNATWVQNKSCRRQVLKLMEILPL